MLLAASFGAAAADPGYYLVTPYDHAGELAVDFRYWTTDSSGREATLWPELGVSYGINSRWSTEFYASWIGKDLDALNLSTLNWQNDLLLTQGEVPFDLAIHTNLIHFDGVRDGYAIEAGPLLQTDVGRTQLNANLFLEHNHAPDEPRRPQLKYQWQARYRWKPYLHAGVQGFGELGDWNRWAPGSEQSHRAGPVIAGSLLAGNGQELRYDFAWLSGSTYGRHGRMFTMRLQYVFL